MTISHVAALLGGGTWLYVTGHKPEGVIMYAIAAALFLGTLLASGGMRPLP